MAKNVLEIKDLYVQYNCDDSTVYAVNDFNLTVADGKTFGLVGETGAGKTTTCLSILRLLPYKVGEIISGEINFMGEDILKMSDDHMRNLRGSEISMIFQDPMTSLNPVLTVGDQIYEEMCIRDRCFPRC